MENIPGMSAYHHLGAQPGYGAGQFGHQGMFIWWTSRSNKSSKASDHNQRRTEGSSFSHCDLKVGGGSTRFKHFGLCSTDLRRKEGKLAVKEFNAFGSRALLRLKQDWSKGGTVG